MSVLFVGRSGDRCYYFDTDDNSKFDVSEYPDFYTIETILSEHEYNYFLQHLQIISNKYVRCVHNSSIDSIIEKLKSSDGVSFYDSIRMSELNECINTYNLSDADSIEVSSYFENKLFDRSCIDMVFNDKISLGKHILEFSVESDSVTDTSIFISVADKLMMSPKCKNYILLRDGRILKLKLIEG